MERVSRKIESRTRRAGDEREDQHDEHCTERTGPGEEAAAGRQLIDRGEVERDGHLPEVERERLDGDRDALEQGHTAPGVGQIQITVTTDVYDNVSTPQGEPNKTASLTEASALGPYPDLVVIYLGMRVRNLRGVPKLLRTGRQIQAGVAEKPDGLLRHENLLLSLAPPRLGMRQYWRDLEALERWTRDLPHKEWWHDFLRDSAGT